MKNKFISKNKEVTKRYDVEEVFNQIWANFHCVHEKWRFLRQSVPFYPRLRYISKVCSFYRKVKFPPVSWPLKQSRVIRNNFENFQFFFINSYKIINIVVIINSVESFSPYIFKFFVIFPNHLKKRSNPLFFILFIVMVMRFISSLGNSHLSYLFGKIGKIRKYIAVNWFHSFSAIFSGIYSSSVIYLGSVLVN